MPTCKLAGEVCAYFLCHNEVCVCVCTSVLRCFLLLGVFLGHYWVFWVFYWYYGQTSRPSTFHRPVMRSEGTDLWWGIWHRWILGRGGGVDGWSLTHHLDTVRLLVCVCVCVWNHKKVSHWSPDVNCWAESQKTRKWGDSLQLLRSLTFSLMHLHSIQQTMRVMGDNGADTNKSAPLG